MKRARDIIIARLVQLPRILALAQSFGVSSHLSCGPQRSKNYIHNIPLEQRGYSDVTRPFLSVKGLAPQTKFYLNLIRRILAEFLGTGLFVFVAVSVSSTVWLDWQNGTHIQSASATLVALASGLAYAAMMAATLHVR